MRAGPVPVKMSGRRDVTIEVGKRMPTLVLIAAGVMALF
jgi:hypothetical protein